MGGANGLAGANGSAGSIVEESPAGELGSSAPPSSSDSVDRIGFSPFLRITLFTCRFRSFSKYMSDSGW